MLIPTILGDWRVLVTRVCPEGVKSWLHKSMQNQHDGCVSVFLRTTGTFTAFIYL